MFSTNSLTDGQLVSCVMTGADFCNTSATFSSNAIAMQVKPIVSAGVSIEYSPDNPVDPCYGDLLTFTSHPSNG